MYSNVFFEAYDRESSNELQDGLKGKRIQLRCYNGKPSIQAAAPYSESEIQADLLKGVIAGTIKVEDLPALRAFSKGDVSLFEEWSVFKKQIESKGFEKVKEEVEENASRIQGRIKQEEAKLEELGKVYHDILLKKEAILAEISSALMLLQGEEGLQGTCSIHYHHDTPEIVRIGDGYDNLNSAFQKAGTRKGLYVICENKIHKIHHIFLEEKGRAFLLAEEKEYLKKGPENIREIIDTVEKLQ